MKTAVPVSAVIATRNRPASLARTVNSLASQTLTPAELIIVDASDEDQRKGSATKSNEPIGASCVVRWISAVRRGAAAQRNEGVATATQPFIWFFDDDVLFEPDCIDALWNAMERDSQLGGVNAMITNQRYQSPGVASRFIFTLMNGGSEKSFAGKVIGPAINLLSEDREDLPEVVPVEWLNTTCTMYRRDALASPPFDPFFTGYSMMEDLALSLRVAQNGWKLANARTARIYHDSQTSDHKMDATVVASMELINRHYIMTKILKKEGFLDHAKLAIWELFSLASLIPSRTGRTQLAPSLLGKCKALAHLLRSGSTADE
jgi:GT2 family glycosyltransferase